MNALRSTTRLMGPCQATLLHLHRNTFLSRQASRSFSDNANPRPLLTIQHDKSVLDTLKFMALNKAGSVLVTTSVGKPEIMGIFTERDYLTKLKIAGRSSNTTAVGEIMSAPILAADAHSTLTERACAMIDMHLRHLPVLTSSASNPLDANPVRASHKALKVSDVKSLTSIKDLLRIMHATVSGLTSSGGPDPLGQVTTNDLVRPEQCVGISPEASVLDAVNKMVDRKVGALLILDGSAARHTVGIFTERDYLTKIVLQGKVSDNIKVHDVMTHNPVFASPDESFRSLLDKLVSNHFRHLPVDGGVGKLAGVVSARDLLRVVTLPENVGLFAAAELH